MALTQGAWTVRTIGKNLVLECDVTATTAENDAYTLKTPKGSIDPTRPWILMVNTAAATLDGTTLPVDIWAGYADDFAITGNDSTLGATSGGEVASAIMDDVQAEALVVTVNPDRTAAKVQAVTNTAGEVNAGVAPYYAINLDGAGTLDAATCHFVIIQ